MRCLSLSLALGLGALGIVATTPGSAKALPPVSVTGSRTNGNGNVNVFGLPTVRIQSNGFGTTETIYSPGGYRTVFTPNGITRLWYGSSFTTVNFNPITGYTVRSSSPSVTGFVFSPYGGLRSVNVPSFTSISNSALGLNSTFTGVNFRGSLNIPIPGTGTFMNLSAANLNAIAAASMMSSGSCGNMGATAAAYQNYVPPSLISN